MVERNNIAAIIAGYVDVSLNDVIGETSFVVWFCGCNFRCPYCQNFPMVILSPKLCKKTFLSTIIRRLIEVKNFVNYIQVTGGEPTLQSQQLQYIYEKAKELGLKTSLDTNGSNPQVIDILKEKKLIDHLAMDIKSPLNVHKLARVTGLAEEIASIYVDRIKKSLSVSKELEFVEIRTTYVPNLLSEKDIIRIAIFLQEYLVKPRHYYILQQFIPNENAPEPSYRKGRVVGLEKLYAIAKKVREFLPNVAIRHIGGVKYID